MSSTGPNFLNSRDFARIARAIRFIDANFREQPCLAQIAAQADLSEFHFNRLFRRWAGVTPKQYLAYVTGSAAKDALHAHPSVLDAAYSVGLSGPGRLHDLIVTLDAMTPGELKAQGNGLTIRYGFAETPFGTASIAATERGVCHLGFVETGEEEAASGELRTRWPLARLQHDEAHAGLLAERIWRANGEGTPLRVNVVGTNFQLKVWQALLELGAQETTTYGELASAIGHPGGARAVGNAVGANPVGWLIPCHNVLRKDGSLGSYRWGEDRKLAIQAWKSLPPAASDL